MDSETLINLVVGLSAVVVMLPYYDRLRQMNWRTHRWDALALHLCFALWLGFVAWAALMENKLADWHDIFAVLAGGSWIHLSHATWRDGPPEHIETAPATLDAKVLR